MMTFTEHQSVTCPDCGEPLMYGMKEETTGWKVYYDCKEQCGWERSLGVIDMSEVADRDEMEARAEEMGEQFGEP
jgi:predicted RNA-binding Zn-ribbon protein involved in translation (DUF1610 family)